VASSVFYLSFAAGGGKDLAVGGLRYFAPWFPLWGVLAALGLLFLLPGTALPRVGRHRRLGPSDPARGRDGNR
jgi:hypothetical protein